MARIFALFVALLAGVILWLVVGNEVKSEKQTVATTSLPNNPTLAAILAPTALATEGAGAARQPENPVQNVGLAAAIPLQPGDPTQANGFGTAVAVWEDIVVVGAPRANHGAGAVYLFQRVDGQWHELARLTASDGVANDAFGHSVAIYNQTLLVGATGHDAAGWEAGAVYVFEPEEGVWREQHKLLPGSATDARFGWAVALDGTTAVIGAPYRFSQGEMLRVGAVTIFSVPDWQPQVRLTTGKTGGAGSSDLFGSAVAVHNSTVAAGAQLSDAVYLYQRVGAQWEQSVVLQHSARGSQFGYSIALAEDRLLVGAPAAEANGPRGGTAVLYTRHNDTWHETTTLTAANLGTGGRLGSSVALAGNLLAVSTPESDGRSYLEASGMVALFCQIDGQPVRAGELSVTAPAPFALFGHAVAARSDAAVVAAPTRDNIMGSVHYYALDRSSLPCPNS